MQQMGCLTLGSRLKRLSDVLYRDVAEIYRARGIDLNPTYYPLFNLLHMRGPLSVTQAAELLFVSHPAISKIARSMIADELIYKAPDPSDERRSFLALDKKSLALLQQLEPVWQHMKNYLDTLMAQQQHPLLEALNEFERDYQRKGFIDPILQSLATPSLAQVEISGWDSALREDFKRLNLDWINGYFNGELNQLDQQALNNPESYYLSRGGYIWFAKLESDVVGCVALANHGDGIWEISKMGVDQAYQGFGIGRQLLLVALQKARQLNAARLYLETSSKLPKAITLYRNTGFVEGAHPKGKSEYARSDIYMELPL
ncbi:MAG: bifunctional helix-turn-helix transcriptional regulator/GNAT family N-acetyltransferase [Pseudomonadales bacterium]